MNHVIGLLVLHSAK